MSKNNRFINDFNHENWKKTEELDHDKNLTQILLRYKYF